MHTEHAPRRSWRPVALLIGSCIVLVLILALIGQLRSAIDPEARAAAAAERARQEAINSRLEPLDTLVAASWRILPLALIAGGGAIGLLAAYNRYAHPESVHADKVISLQRAQSQRYPERLHSLSIHDSSRQLAPHTVAAETPALSPPAVPDFGALVARGDIGPGRPMVLGYLESGAPLHGGWRDLYSTLVSGQSGTGKSTTQRFFAGQAALQNARFVVIDPHMDAGDDSLAATLSPLRTCYECEPASTERAILEAVKLARDIGEKRLHGQDKRRTPLLVWCDEATALLSHSKIGPDLAELLEVISQQYRKVGIFASVSAQIVTASRTGGDSALRDSMASVICHKMRRSQARLVLPLEDSQLVERLSPGRAVLWRTSGQSEVITIPNTSAGDMRAVAHLLTGSQPTMQRLRQAQMGAYAGATLEPVWSQSGAGDSAVGRGAPPSAAEARVLALFAGGADIPAIVKELYGVTSASGSTYQARSREVQALLRRAVQ